MKNHFDLVPGNTEHYRLVPGNTDHYRLIPGHAKHFDLIPGNAPQFTLIPTPKAPPTRSPSHNRQLREIRRMGEEAKGAIDQLCAVFVFTEDRVLRAWTAAQLIRGQHTSDEEIQQLSVFRALSTQRLLQRVLAVVETKGNAILARIGYKM